MDEIIIRKAKHEDCKAIRNLIQVVLIYNLLLHIIIISQKNFKLLHIFLGIS